MIEGFFRLEIFDSGILGDYFGVDFWSRDAFLALLEALGIFWGFDICPHHLKSGVFCSKIALLKGVTRTSKSCAPKAKSCLKVAEHDQDRAGDTLPVSSGLGQPLIHTLNFLVTLSSL